MSFNVRRHGRLGVGLVAGIAVATLLGACGSSNSTTASAGASGGASGSSIAKAKAAIDAMQSAVTAYPGITPTRNPVDLHGKKITIVPLSDSVDILAAIADNAKIALQHMGATVNVCDGKGDPTDVSTCLQQAHAEHDAAVATTFVPYDMVPNVFTALASAGTKVIINGDAATPGQTYPANVSFNIMTKDLDVLSKLQGDAALADFGTEANVINFMQTQTANQVEQGDTVSHEIKALCPSCQVTDVKSSLSNASQLASQISAALVADPKANVVEVANDDFIPQIRQGIAAAGKSAGLGTGHVEIISNGSDLSALQLVKSGVVAHDIGNSGVFDGYSFADAIEKSLSGDRVPAVPAVTRDFVQSNVQGLPLTTAAYNTMTWFGNDSFKDEYYKAWGGQ